jgi:hypothetical protein
MRVPVIGRAAADASLSVSLGVSGRMFKVTSVEYVPEADVTGVATNSLTLELRNRGPSDAINVLIAQLALVAGINAKVRQAKTITLQPVTDGPFVVRDTDRLEWVSVKVGTGLADPGGFVIVTEGVV